MAPVPNRTAFILVPGAFVPGTYFEKVANRLRSEGFEAVAIDNPSIRGTDQPPASMYDDAENIRGHACNLMHQGKNVVVVANSYGGFIATEAMKGLTSHSRFIARESKGEVVGLVLIASLLAPAGVTCSGMLAEALDKPALLKKSEKDFEDPPPPKSALVIMNGVPEEEALAYGHQARPRSSISPHQELTYEGWKYVPTTMIITETDRVVAAAAQHESADDAIAKGYKNVKKVSIDAGHCAMISHPDEVVDILLSAAS